MPIRRRTRGSCLFSVGELRHCLDVRRLGVEVEELQLIEREPVPAKLPEVARECHGVAGNIEQARRGMAAQPLADLGGQPWPGGSTITASRGTAAAPEAIHCSTLMGKNWPPGPPLLRRAKEMLSVLDSTPMMRSNR